MARVQGSKDIISLANGLITEASPLAAPEGSTSDELNFTFELNQGIRKRRSGFQNLNSDFTKNVAGSTGCTMLNSVYWKEHDLFAVVLAFAGANETWIRFHSNDSTYTYKGEFQLTSTELTTAYVSEVRGSLVITGDASGTPTNPLFIERLDSGTTNFYTVSIFIRDFELLGDSSSISNRPATLNEEHDYNLKNSGWYALRPTEDSSTPVDVQAYVFTQKGVYPSNADVPQVGLRRMKTVMRYSVPIHCLKSL